MLRGKQRNSAWLKYAAALAIIHLAGIALLWKVLRLEKVQNKINDQAEE